MERAKPEIPIHYALLLCPNSRDAIESRSSAKKERERESVCMQMSVCVCVLRERNGERRRRRRYWVAGSAAPFRLWFTFQSMRACAGRERECGGGGCRGHMMSSAGLFTTRRGRASRVFSRRCDTLTTRCRVWRGSWV